jgi:dephospho-CoA kinase
MIIGITGTIGAGKGTIVEYLVSRGFKYYSARDYLIEKIKEMSLEINRDNMVIVGNELREKYGPSHIAEEMMKKATKDKKDAVIESIRAVGEIYSLRKNKDFLLFAVDADIKKRYERIVKRNKETDNVSFKKFCDDEKKEFTSNDPNKQNLKACIERSDYKFINNGTIEELHKQVEGVLHEFRD